MVCDRRAMTPPDFNRPAAVAQLESLVCELTREEEWLVLAHNAGLGNPDSLDHLSRIRQRLRLYLQTLEGIGATVVSRE
jgi:hypothetical protein